MQDTCVYANNSRHCMPGVCAVLQAIRTLLWSKSEISECRDNDSVYKVERLLSERPKRSDRAHLERSITCGNDDSNDSF